MGYSARAQPEFEFFLQGNAGWYCKAQPSLLTWFLAILDCCSGKETYPSSPLELQRWARLRFCMLHAEHSHDGWKLSKYNFEISGEGMGTQKRVLVTGAGGFIGHHLVKRLKSDGHWVRGVDIKYPEYEASASDAFEILDLRKAENCLLATRGGIDEVYNLAADMGGIGYITAYLADISRNNILINAHMLEASRQNGVQRFLFSSSACVYNQSKQQDAAVTALREEDAHPADPEPGYGWEKLFAEELCRYYYKDYGFETRIVRFHNVYGPLGTYEGGKEKAPAAICRKLALAEDDGEIEVWGDGEQTRSFMYVDDCVEGLIHIIASDYREPLNLGRAELVTINELVNLVARIAGKRITKRHNLSGPQGVRGRNSNNTRLRKVLGWEPSVSLERGLVSTFEWIAAQVRSKYSPSAMVSAAAD